MKLYRVLKSELSNNGDLCIARFGFSLTIILRWLILTVLLVSTPLVVASEEGQFVTRGKTLEVFVRDGCPHCARAKKMLEERGLGYEEVQVGRDISQHCLRGLAGSASVPQVFIGGKLIGGADDLESYFAK